MTVQPKKQGLVHQRICVRLPHFYRLVKQNGFLFLRNLVGALSHLCADVSCFSQLLSSYRCRLRAPRASDRR